MKNELRKLVVDGLRELSDIELQKKLWLGGDPSEMSSFDEAICCLYDDSGLTILLPRREIVFSKEIDAQLRVLSDLIANMDQETNNMAPQDLIYHKQMEEIRRVANSILSQLE